MTAAGTPPEYVYAYKKTHRLLSQDTYARLSPAEQEEWDAAIAEYFALTETEH